MVPTAPFALPSVWDVVPSVKPSSRFAKYDIRDGFWHMPIAEDNKKRLRQSWSVCERGSRERASTSTCLSTTCWWWATMRRSPLRVAGCLKLSLRLWACSGL
eukprot:6931542-Prymnesium_polylepis.1